MRILLFAGASALAFSVPALAQEGENISTATAGGTPIDTLEPAEPSAGETKLPAPTGNPVLDRLNALEARVKQLEARNAQLEQQAELDQTRLQSVEARSAKAAQFAWAPTISEPTGQFTFKPSSSATGATTTPTARACGGRASVLKARPSNGGTTALRSTSPATR
jgi:phosphate-selective porin OprO and OprP